jgi:two-component system chemotaxis response regulator CheY
MRNLRMLIVEDDYLAQQILKAGVAEYGKAETANDGNQATGDIERAYEEGRPFDLVFMDIKLSGLNGLEALGRIRDYEKSYGVPDRDACKILVTTGLSDPHFVLESFKQGCDGFLVKPYSKEELAAAITKLGLLV